MCKREPLEVIKAPNSLYPRTMQLITLRMTFFKRDRLFLRLVLHMNGHTKTSTSVTGKHQNAHFLLWKVFSALFENAERHPIFTFMRKAESIANWVHSRALQFQNIRAVLSSMEPTQIWKRFKRQFGKGTWWKKLIHRMQRLFRL